MLGIAACAARPNLHKQL